MASACSKSVDDQGIDEYMKDSSTCYFGQLFPNSNISIESKAKKGKQAGHVVVVNFIDSYSTGNIIKVIHRYDQKLITDIFSIFQEEGLNEVERRNFLDER